MDPKKIEAVKNYPTPSTPKKCKQFTSLCSYYRRFVKGFAKIARPLYQLQHKDVPFIWGPKEQESFETLRKLLCEEPILIAPDMDKPFVISCDASDYAVGAILEQEKDGKMHPCAYASRTLKGPELRYSTYDKELTAIVFAKDQFHYYLFGKPFTVISDCEALKHFHKTKKPDLRFNRLKAELRGLDFQIIYRKGILNPADALSRNPIIGDGEENPERPRAELYQLAEKQENENNDTTRILITTRSQIPGNKRPRKHYAYNEDMSSSEPASKIPKQSDHASCTTSDESSNENTNEKSYCKFKNSKSSKVKNKIPLKHSPILSQSTGNKFRYMAKNPDHKKLEKDIKIMSTPKSQTYKYMERANLLNKLNLNSTDDESDNSLGNKSSDPELFPTKEQTKKPVILQEPKFKVSQPIIRLPRIDTLLNREAYSHDHEKTTACNNNSNVNASLEVIELLECDNKNRDGEIITSTYTADENIDDKLLNENSIILENTINKNLLGPEIKTNNNLPCNSIFTDTFANIKIKNEANYSLNIEKEVNGKTSFSIELYETDNNNETEQKFSQNYNINHNTKFPGTNVSLSDINEKSFPEPTGPSLNLPNNDSDVTYEMYLKDMPNSIDKMDHTNDDCNTNILTDTANQNDTVLSAVIDTAHYSNYIMSEKCAEESKELIHIKNLKTHPPGNCMFDSLILALDIEDVTGSDMRKYLLDSNSMMYSTNVVQTTRILSSTSEYGDNDCLYVAAKQFNTNICIHYHITENKINFQHFVVNNWKNFIHLHLHNNHYTPYLTINHSAYKQFVIDNEPENNTETNMNNHIDDAAKSPNSTYPPDQSDNTQNNTTIYRLNDTMTRYLVADARQDNGIPKYLPLSGEKVCFKAIQSLDEHAFAYKDNLAYALTSDFNFKTEVLEALVERRYINIEEIMAAPREVGDIVISRYRDYFIFGLVVKGHLDDRILKSDMTKCLKNLRFLTHKFNITSLGIIRDLALLSTREWRTFLDQGNLIFKERNITIILFKNNLPIPNTGDRYKLIKDYHESTPGGHNGLTKVYHKMAAEFYWRNMKEDIKSVILCCPTCNAKKIIRKKTRLPMVITDSTSSCFTKISIDLCGPLKESPDGFKYILTIQDMLSKYVILIPTKDATALEVAQNLMKYFIAYFGSPETCLTDNGSHFCNKLIQEFCTIFRIHHCKTTAFHPQSNASIKRMHAVLNNYLKMYLDDVEDWVDLLPTAQYSYNNTMHISTGYTPIEIVLGYLPRTPSSLATPNDLPTYEDYLQESVKSLAQTRTLARMNLMQSKYRAKFYYDKRVNAKHFREGQIVKVFKDTKDPTKSRKFQDQYSNPCEIIALNYDTHTATVQKDNKQRTVHFDKLIPMTIAHLPMNSDKEATVNYLSYKNIKNVIKICSFNINGIRSFLKKSNMEYLLKEKPDIIAFQETKCPTDKFPKQAKLPDYKHYFLENKKKGHHGVSIYSKKEPIKILYGLNDIESDKEARAITAEYEKFFLINIYAPYAGKNLENLSKKLTWNKAFINFTTKLDKIKPLIICGDLNVAHTELDVANPHKHVEEAGFTVEERRDMSTLLNNDFTDIFRFLYPNKRTYTFWENR